MYNDIHAFSMRKSFVQLCPLKFAVASIQQLSQQLIRCERCPVEIIMNQLKHKIRTTEIVKELKQANGDNTNFSTFLYQQVVKKMKHNEMNNHQRVSQHILEGVTQNQTVKRMIQKVKMMMMMCKWELTAMFWMLHAILFS